TLTITPVDDAPTLTNNGLTVNEGGSGTIGAAQLAASDPDTLPANLVFTLTAVPANGTLFLSGSPLIVGNTFTQANINANNLTYTHDGSETTSDSFSFTLTDGTTTLPAATFSITITPVNDPPVVDLNGAAAGVNYAATYTENAPATLIVDPSAAVTDPESDNITTLTATIGSCTPAETLSATGGGGVSVAYNPATCTLTLSGPASPTAMSTVLQTLSYVSTDDNPPPSRTITVIATDAGTATSAVATITLTITPVDDAPQLINNGLTVGEGQSATISAAALQASDPDTVPENLRFTLTSLPARGTLRLDGVVIVGGSFTQADINAGRLVYTHDGSETTSDSFSFTLTDGTTTLPVATFNITITPENDNPIVTTSAGSTFYVQGQPPVVIDPEVTVSDADSPNFGGGSLSVALTGGAPQDQLDVLNQGDGPGQIGSSGGIVRYGGVAIGSLSVSSGGPLVVLFNANATPEAVQALARAVTFANTAAVTTSGPRTATFIISDGAGGNSVPATKVIDINLLPVAVNDTAQVIMNSSIRLNLLANDSDPDGDPVTITAVSAPGHGTATIIASGQAVRYTPNPNYRGADSFTYTVSDGRGGTATATVNLNVDQARIFLPLVNDRPVEPDLVVRFELDPNQPRAFSPATVRVTVTNRGRGPASNFWVDFYVNPRQVPAVNEPWNELCRDRNCRGIAWFYEGTLRPGESVTFTSTPQSASNPTGYQPRYTIWDGFFENGSYSLYAYVDSWNRDAGGTARNPRGAIEEENEDNNLAERQVTIEVSP
ncbi:MAG: cadherin-like domain-containing protein, partial [Chloroflexaceae bacterium]